MYWRRGLLVRGYVGAIFRRVQEYGVVLIEILVEAA
jgi:hypothetical protein